MSDCRPRIYVVNAGAAGNGFGGVGAGIAAPPPLIGNNNVNPEGETVIQVEEDPNDTTTTTTTTTDDGDGDDTDDTPVNFVANRAGGRVIRRRVIRLQPGLRRGGVVGIPNNNKVRRIRRIIIRRVNRRRPVVQRIIRI